MSGDYPIPTNDDHRLSVLRSYGILDTGTDERFDRLNRLAARYFQVPIAVIAFIDSERQWFKSCIGFGDVSETPRDASFCAHTIMDDRPMLVRDATADPRFANNPCVTGETNVRFYAGAPLTVPEGVRIGTICVLDTMPRPYFAEEDLEVLEEFAELIVEVLVDWKRSHDALEAAGDELDKARAAADAGSRAKKEFLDLVGHELRTPLTAILGFGRLIAEKPAIATDERKEFAKFICEAGERLQKIVDTVMTFSQVERGEIELHEEVFPVAEILRTSAHLIEPEARAKSISLDIATATPEAGLRLNADRLHMEQVLMQLLDNAVRFSPEESRIAVGVRRDADQRLRIEIADQGPGIAREDHAAALEMFGKLDQGLARSHSGIGLGLPISQKLAQRHGGGLEIGARPEGGTLVSVVIPAYRVLDCDAAPLRLDAAV